MRSTSSDRWREPNAAETTKDENSGLQLLLDAYMQAHRGHVPPADLAIPLNQLAQNGLVRDKLQRLVMAGLIEEQVSKASATGRARIYRGLAEGFVLTPFGATEVFQVLYGMGMRTDTATGKTAQTHPQTRVGLREQPFWDDAARELWWRSCLVKRFRNDAANQRQILTAFQEQDWVSRIDDPLPRTARLNRKGRLREAVKSLQRGQKPLAIRFHADGTCQGIRWESVT